MRPRILVIDDSDEFREPLVDLLDLSGYDAVGAASFEEGLRWLQKDAVAFVVTERGMETPDDVSEHVARLREAARPAGVGVVSGWRMDRILAMSKGAAFTLQKPVDPPMLLSRLAENTAPAVLAPARASAIESYFAQLTARDWDALVALCTEDVEYHLPGRDARFSRTIRGRLEFRAFTVETFVHFADARFTVESIVPLPAPDTAVARYRSAWTGPKGVLQSISGAVVFEFRGDLVARIGVRTDLEELSRKQTGLSEPT